MDTQLAIVLFVVFDALVIFLVLSRVIKLKGSLTVAVNGVDFRAMMRLTKELDQEASRYFEANYSGDLQQLPQAMQGFLALARARAQQDGITIDDTILKKVVESAAVKHRIAKADAIRSALEHAA